MRLLIVAAILLFSSCGSESESIDAPLEREQFKAALRGALLVESRANKERVELKRDTIPIDLYYQVMFEEVGVSESEFTETYIEYTKHMEAFEVIYEEVAEELQIEVDSLQRLLN